MASTPPGRRLGAKFGAVWYGDGAPGAVWYGDGAPGAVWYGDGAPGALGYGGGVFAVGNEKGWGSAAPAGKDEATAATGGGLVPSRIYSMHLWSLGERG